MKNQKPKISDNLTETRNFQTFAVSCAKEETVVRGILCKSEKILSADVYALDLRGSVLQNCVFEDCGFEKASFSDVIFKDCNFSGCTFSESWFNRCQFENCKAVGAAFAESVCKNTELHNSNFSYLSI